MTRVINDGWGTMWSLCKTSYYHTDWYDKCVDELTCTGCMGPIGWDSQYGFTEFWVNLRENGEMVCDDCLSEHLDHLARHDKAGA